MSAEAWIALVGVGCGAAGYFIRVGIKETRERQDRRDLNGLGHKLCKVLALLNEWDDLDPKDRRARISRIVEGK